MESCAGRKGQNKPSLWYCLTGNVYFVTFNINHP